MSRPDQRRLRLVQQLPHVFQTPINMNAHDLHEHLFDARIILDRQDGAESEYTSDGSKSKVLRKASQWSASIILTCGQACCSDLLSLSSSSDARARRSYLPGAWILLVLRSKSRFLERLFVERDHIRMPTGFAPGRNHNIMTRDTGRPP